MDGVYKHYIIDMSCNNNFVQIPAVQGDGNNVRGFEVELISNNVQYVVDAENTIVSIAGTKPDTKQILNECQVTEEGYILVDITSQMSAVAGRGDYSIVLMDKHTNSQLKSFPFYILTTASAFNVSDIVSSDEFQLLTKKITDVENLHNEIMGYEEERQKNEDIRNSNEETRLSNEEVRKQNEEERIQSENIRKETENIRISNEDIRAQQESVRQENERIRIETEEARKVSEATRESNETQRIEGEEFRSSEENIRNENEKIRIENESTRESQELQRIENENVRIENETVRQEQETTRQSTSASAIEAIERARLRSNEATQRANNISDDLEHKIATDYYRGEPGKDGVITTVEMNQMAFNIVEGNLILTYEEGNTDANNFSINNNGDLIYTIS